MSISLYWPNQLHVHLIYMMIIVCPCFVDIWLLFSLLSHQEKCALPSKSLYRPTLKFLIYQKGIYSLKFFFFSKHNIFNIPREKYNSGKSVLLTWMLYKISRVENLHYTSIFAIVPKGTELFCKRPASYEYLSALLGVNVSLWVVVKNPEFLKGGIICDRLIWKTN
jgi:hypothetical protein